MRKEDLYGSRYERDYLRVTVQRLIRFNQPVIIRGRYHQNTDESKYISIQDVHPYVKGRETRILCDHVNILQSFIEDLYGERWSACAPHGTILFLVCRPYIYMGECYRRRGGFSLTDELGIPPIQLNTHFLRQIPQKRYVDFATFAHGKYLMPTGEALAREEKKKQEKRRNAALNEINKSKRKRAKERRKEKEAEKWKACNHVEQLLEQLKVH